MVLNNLWEDYQIAKIRGDEYFHNRPLRNWLFPKLEELGIFIHDPEEYQRRQKRIERIKEEAEVNRKKLKEMLAKKREF